MRPSRLVLFILVSTLVGGFAGGARATESEVEIVHKTTLTREHVTEMSRNGALVVHEIRAARAAIAQRDRVAAKRRTGAANRILQRVRAASPTLRLHDSILAAQSKLARTGSLDAKQDLLPIETEMDSLEISKDDSIREQITRARAAHAKGPTEDVAAALAEAAASVHFTEIDLPIEETQQKLVKALHLLGRRRLPAADSMLADAQDQVHVFVGMANVALADVGTAELASAEGL